MILLLSAQKGLFAPPCSMITALSTSQGLHGHFWEGAQSPLKTRMTARVAQFGISSQQTPTFCCSTERRHLGWLERHGSPIPRLPLGSRDSADRGEGSHLLARFDRGTSAGGTSARGAFAHPLEHVGQVPAGVPGSAQWWWALAPCSLLRSVGMERQDSARGGRRRSKEQLLGGSSPNAGEQQQRQRWRHI